MGAGRWEAGDGPAPGGRGRTRHRTLSPSLSCALWPPARAARLTHRTGLSSEREEAPGPSWGGGPPCSPEPGSGGFAVEDRAWAGGARDPASAGCAR